MSKLRAGPGRLTGETGIGIGLRSMGAVRYLLSPVGIVIARFPGLIVNRVFLLECVDILLRLHLYHDRIETLKGGVGLDMGCVDGEVGTLHETVPHALGDDLVEDLLKESAFAKAVVTVVGEGRVIGYRIFEVEPHEPPITEVHLHVFT